MSFAKQIDGSHDFAGKRIASRCTGGRRIKGRDRGGLGFSPGDLFRPGAAEGDIAKLTGPVHFAPLPNENKDRT